MDNDDLKTTEEVSAAYQALDKEVPPAKLDELILQAAKSELKKPQADKNVFHYRRYSIAASVCLCVLIASIFVNNEPPSLSSNTVSSQKSSPLRSKTESTEINEARSEASLESAAFVDAPLEEADENSRADLLIQTEEDSDAAAGQELEETIVTASRIVRSDQAAASPVLGFDYRNSVELWLQEIQSLLESDEAAAQEEINLFTQAFPDIDLDSALNEIE